ncbi:MAG: hypothetical protein ABJF23_19520 [Bryobacteraceae bacterium]
MKIGMAVCLMICFSPFLSADRASDRAKLSGTWTPEDANQKEVETFVIENGPEKIHMARKHGDGKVFDIDCSSLAKECQLKDEDGKDAKITMYFNGNKLVQLETKGTKVVKRRFGMTKDDNVMKLEVIPIVPNGKPETILYKRVQAALAQ